MAAAGVEFGTRVTRGGAAFANAEMAMAGGKWDTFRMLTHPGTSIIPGAFVAAEMSGASGRDFLTGLLNARMFDEALARRCSTARPFLLLLGDMDNLKQLNDTHGHSTGNSELRRLADVLSQAVEPGDDLARVGGDEFAILTEVRVAEAGALCARLRAELAAEDIQMTFGWAALPEDSLGPLDLFRKADDRLYAAKMIQRNHRVVEQLTRAAVAPPGSN